MKNVGAPTNFSVLKMKQNCWIRWGVGGAMFLNHGSLSALLSLISSSSSSATTTPSSSSSSNHHHHRINTADVAADGSCRFRTRRKTDHGGFPCQSGGRVLCITLMCCYYPPPPANRVDLGFFCNINFPILLTLVPLRQYFSLNFFRFTPPGPRTYPFIGLLQN